MGKNNWENALIKNWRWKPRGIPTKILADVVEKAKSVKPDNHEKHRREGCYGLW